MKYQVPIKQMHSLNRLSRSQCHLQRPRWCTKKHPAQVYGLSTDGPANRPPTNPVTIRPRGSMVSPLTVRHPAPTSVENTMHTIRIKNKSQTGLVASNDYLVKRAYRQDQFSNPFKIFFHKMCQVVRMRFEINFINLQQFRKTFYKPYTTWVL